MDEARLQVLRLRLPGRRGHLHLLRLADGAPQAGYRGSEPVAVRHGRVLAAHSRTALLRVNDEQQVLTALGDGVVHVDDTVHVIDARRCRRALARAHQRWTGPVRGTIIAVDDLLFDAAASLGDATAVARTIDPLGFHGLYRYIWGEVDEPPPLPRRLRLWDERMTWLQQHLDVLDAHRRPLAYRR